MMDITASNSVFVEAAMDEGADARMEERLRALEQEATANIERAALFSIEVGRSIVLLSKRVTQLEERLAVLEEDRATPGMTPAQYIALRSQWQ